LCEKQKARHTLRIEFTYDATGAKLRKTVYTNNVITEKRDYVNGIEYKGGVLDRFAHTEGAVVRNENGVFEHQYVIKDHLGNARITYRDGINKVDNTGNTTYNDGTIVAADMMQINHYYPFGMNMEGNWNGLNGKNKYQYNGKELNEDFGLNWNDYGFRMYDPAIGRWSVPDALSEKYYRYSPYHYAKDNPIRNIDLLGLASWDNNDSGGKSQHEKIIEHKRNNIDGRKGITSGSGGDGGNDWIRQGDKYTHVKDQGLSLEAAKTKYGSDVSEVHGDYEGHSYSTEGGRRVTLGANGWWNYEDAYSDTDKAGNIAGLIGDLHDIPFSAIAAVEPKLQGLSSFENITGSIAAVGHVSAAIGITIDILQIRNNYKLNGEIGVGDVSKLVYDGLVIRFGGAYGGAADGVWSLAGGKDSFFNSINSMFSSKTWSKVNDGLAKSVLSITKCDGNKNDSNVD
jgi:RHS repeat-associated protein